MGFACVLVTDRFIFSAVVLKFCCRYFCEHFGRLFLQESYFIKLALCKSIDFLSVKRAGRIVG